MLLGEGEGLRLSSVFFNRDLSGRRQAPQGLPASQPWGDGDPRLGYQTRERLSLINVSAQQPFPAEGCQPSVRVGMHGS